MLSEHIKRATTIKTLRESEIRDGLHSCNEADHDNNSNQQEARRSIHKRLSCMGGLGNSKETADTSPGIV